MIIQKPLIVIIWTDIVIAIRLVKLEEIKKIFIITLNCVKNDNEMTVWLL